MTTRHSVLLKEEECRGCTNCVQNCPTRAIRVHEGKASIREQLCIDCAECIRICEYHAKYTRTDSLSEISQYRYPLVVVPPSFYGQFNDKHPVLIMEALASLGFTEVFNAARAAEALSVKTARLIAESSDYYISSSCPVVVRLICKKYPELLERLLPYRSPVELTAQQAYRQLLANEDTVEEDIGVFFITPCPAKLTSVYRGVREEKSFLDRALSADNMYEQVLSVLKQEGRESSAISADKNRVIPYRGLNWGCSGGEAEILSGLDQKFTLSVSGIDRVQRVLEELVRENISGVSYFELVSCPGGCSGGVLNVKNSYQARMNLEKLSSKFNPEEADLIAEEAEYDWQQLPVPEPEQVDRLDDSMEQALKKLDQLEEEKEILPGLDCASCGAPDCETLAEDIVRGLASRTDCIFMLRQEIQNLAEQITSLTRELPPVMSDNKQNNKQGDESNDRTGDN